MEKCKTGTKLVILFVLLFSLTLPAAEAEKKALHIAAVKEKIKIDGKLDEPVYQRLKPVSGFVQNHPENGKKPTFKTEVYAFYDKKNIYFAFRCFDKEPGKIAADVTPFGRYENNDEVRVLLDTFSDKRNYEIFAVNPKGAKKGKRTVWDADAKITGSGWNAEFKIPFKSLRFPVKQAQHWAVNFRRDIFRINEILYWSHVERDKQNVIGDTFAKLEGIRDIKGGKNIEIFPYAGYRNSFAGEEKDNKFAYGVDLKYGITSNLTLDATSSPDYSEVESDPFFYQLSPFEVGLAENRPFYAEGSDYFDTYFDLFYSRRISHPTLAAKVTGKEKGFSLGMLGARNKNGDVDSFHGVFRLKKDIFKLSHVGMIYSSIEEEGNWNRNLGVDFYFRFKDIYRLSGMAAFSYNKDQPRKKNGMYNLYFARQPGKGLILLGLYKQVDPEVYVPAGYVHNVDYRQFIGVVKYTWRWEGKWLEKASVLFWKHNVNAVSSGIEAEDIYQFIFDAHTKNRINLNMSYAFGDVRAKILDENSGQLAWDDISYPGKNFSLGLSYSGSRVMEIGANATWIYDYVYNDAFTGTLPGKCLFADLWTNFKISPQVQWRLTYQKVRYHSIDDTIRFNGDLISTTLNLQLNKRLSSFLKFQYDSAAERFQYDFLIGYEPANVSKIYISIKNYSEQRFRLFDPYARSVTFKISYLFRI